MITALLRVKYVFPSYERWVGRACLGLGDAYEQTKDVRRARESYLTVLKLKTEHHGHRRSPTTSKENGAAVVRA